MADQATIDAAHKDALKHEKMMGVTPAGGIVTVEVEKIEAKLINFFSDNGLPLPLVRHNGRGDLVATIVALFATCVAFLLVFGGSAYSGHGLAIKVPTLTSFSGAATALVSVVGSLVAYVAKRKQDL